MDKYNNYLIPTYSPQPIYFERGQGCYLYDPQNNRYLDFIAGIAVNCLGYNHPILTKAVQDQAEKIIHISNLFPIKEQIELAEVLSNRFAGSKAFFCNSGAEVIEGAIKLARKYAKKTFGENKYEFITMKNSFHGRTLAAITATGQEKYQKDLQPLPQGFSYAQFGNINSIKELITANTCGIIIEPIQGEGGINIASPEFWQELSILCREKNILLILDEIQTGMARTGKFFAHEYYGLKPDIITLAKGIAGGIPMGAVLASQNVAKGFEPGDHASTFGGNYLACVAALAVIKAIDMDNILDNVQKMEKIISNITINYKERFLFINDIRGKGLMWGIDLSEDTDCTSIIEKALEKNLILNCIGGHIIRITPPLIINEEELRVGFGIIEEIFEGWT